MSNITCQGPDGITDPECQKYVDDINTFLVKVWETNETDITRVDLANNNEVQNVVTQLLNTKRDLDNIRNDLDQRNLELDKIKKSLAEVDHTENEQEALNSVNQKNEKVLHYARLLQSADGQQKKGIEKNYKLSVASLLPVNAELCRNLPTLEIPKYNMVLYIKILSLLFIIVLLMLCYTIFKMLRTGLNLKTDNKNLTERVNQVSE